GWTIYDVETFTNIPAPTLAEYERDQSVVPADRLPVLACLLSVSIEWLVTGKETAENLRRKWPEGFNLWAKLTRELNEKDKDRLMILAEAFLKRRDEVVKMLDWGRLKQLQEEAPDSLGPDEGGSDESSGL
ncbi:MAG: helix-turn-helix domain-containing protein, partial [Firmicutes bacterium]|nr:helix-turn-helix domain-containing protein [Bacillota bacterium]